MAEVTAPLRMTPKLRSMLARGLLPNAGRATASHRGDI
jgi:hypothetical protein